MNRRTRVALILLLALSVLSAPPASPPATAQSVRDVVDACYENGGTTELCRGIDHLIQVAGVLCREGAGGTSCTMVDEQTVDPEAVEAHEQSWLGRALAHQRVLGDDQPLRNALWIHTHNSFNADAYPQTLYGLDPNQLYTITDQLRMGSRAIEIDVHWFQHPSGVAENDFNQVVVCHGGIGDDDHIGCGVNDPLLPDRLQEIAAFIEAHPFEVILLFLENELDDDPVAHELAAKMIDGALGDLVYKPGGRCAPLPMDLTRQQVRATGARVVIAGNCGPGSWGDYVHERGPNWKERSLGHGDDFPAYPCEAERRQQNYDENFIRRTADETGLSTGAGVGGDVTLNDARNMIRCGVDMPGLDNLVPFDERLVQFVWSWADKEPNTGGCAYQGEDGRFRSGDCSAPRRFACVDGTGAWFVTPGAGRWDQGPSSCGLVQYDVPRNGWSNELLRNAKGSGEVWLNYATVGPDWVPRPV
jgi:hypothetical protein